MLLTELSELLENLFSKLLAQSITEQEYRQKMTEALIEYDEKVRQLQEVVSSHSSVHSDESIRSEHEPIDTHKEYTELDEFLEINSTT